MSDFESRLTSALRDGAEGAPDVVGLADRARATRARRRRGRVGIAGLVLVVGAIGAVVPLWGGGSGGDRVADAPAGWTTVSFEGVDVDVPASWHVEVVSCFESPTRLVARPVDFDGCVRDQPLVSISPDPRHGPASTGQLSTVNGMAQASVDVGRARIVAIVDDDDAARRILGSVRPTGDPAPDVEGPWRILVEDGVEYTLPDEPVQVTITPRGPSGGSAYTSDLDLDPFRAGQFLDDGRRIDVTAPTEALAQLVAGSARSVESEEWQTVEVDGMRLEVPADWTSPPRCRDVPAGAPAVGAAGAGCRDVPGAFVYQEATYDPVYGPGVQRCKEDRGWCGSTILGDLAVFARAGTDDVVRRILDSAEELP